MVGPGTIRIFPPSSGGFRETHQAALPLGARAASGRGPAQLHHPIMMVDNRYTAETTALPGADRPEAGLSPIVRSRGAVARIACIKPAMRVDNR